MEMAAEKMEAQLKLWRLKIDNLAAKTQKAGAPARFEDLVHIDELKALHAIAQLKLMKFKAVSVGDAERAGHEAELKNVWKELEAALKEPEALGISGRKPRARRIAESAGFEEDESQEPMTRGFPSRSVGSRRRK